MADTPAARTGSGDPFFYFRLLLGLWALGDTTLSVNVSTVWVVI